MPVSTAYILVVPITQEDREFILKPNQGTGGFQRLLGRLQQGVRGHVLTVTRYDAERVVKYAEGYGEGGYQERLRSLAGVVKAELERVGPVERSLFAPDEGKRPEREKTGLEQ